MQEKPTSVDSELDSVLSQLGTDQVRFVIARQDFATDKEAAEFIGYTPDTVSRWKRKGAPIDEAVRLMVNDGLVTALHIRRRNLAKAMAVKVAGLDSDSELIRQKTATEIVEWELGKATQPQEIQGEMSNELIVRYINDWRDGGDSAT